MAEVREILRHLEGQFRRGLVILFTGAGFSQNAKNITGRQMPLSSDLRGQLWTLCFPGETDDRTSTIQDLYQHALLTHRNALSEILRSQLSADGDSVPVEYATWFSMPWYRVYTLNIDDIELATQRRHSLPRKIISVSATAKLTTESNYAGELELVHLNGTLGDIPDDVTFSTLQYAERLASDEAWYIRCVADLLTHPVIFVGTKLDEPPLWQHIVLRRLKGGRGQHELRPRSYLVSTHLDLARRELLSEFNIVWVPLSTTDFATTILQNLKGPAQEGLTALAARIGHKHPEHAGRPIPDVAVLSQAHPLAQSEYLLGQEPIWADIHTGRAIQRDVDTELLTLSRAILKRSAIRGVVLVTGTAGSGKTSGLMRLALSLSAEGVSVGWIDRDSEFSPRDIRDAMRQDKHPAVLMIDDADLYGIEAGALARELPQGPGSPAIFAATRSAKADQIKDAVLSAGIPFREVVMPHLTDADIGGLLDVLDRENRLGILKGMPRRKQEAAFREQAGRQLLVAMMRATSGEPFEEKIITEYRQLEADAMEIYCLVAVVTSLRNYMSRDEILLSLNDRSNASLNTLDNLIRRHLLIPTLDGIGVRVRHRAIADVVMQDIIEQGLIGQVIERISYTMASKTSPGLSRTARPCRLLRALLNHAFLIPITEFQSAREIYSSIEPLLHWDYHYWLQRGSLEVERGDVKKAQHFINQARSMQPDDPLVNTEFAYVLFRLAIEQPSATDSSENVAEAIKILESRIIAHGSTDYYPYHILGSQGLAWSRRSLIGKRERQDLLNLLVKRLEEAITNHPRNRQLKALHDDVKKELLSTALTEADGKS